MDKWPAQYVIDQASYLIQVKIPELEKEISNLKAEIAALEATKADRKGRKPAGVKMLAEESTIERAS